MLQCRLARDRLFEVTVRRVVPANLHNRSTCP